MRLNPGSKGPAADIRKAESCDNSLLKLEMSMLLTPPTDELRLASKFIPLSQIQRDPSVEMPLSTIKLQTPVGIGQQVASPDH